MSATLMGAVMNCGPKDEPLRYTLLAIADNADDYGFACPSVETIAGKVCRDERTAMRRLQKLERDGWLKVRRRALSGRWSVYFVNLEKLGVKVGVKSRKSPLHLEIEKELAKEAAAQPKPDAPAAPNAGRVKAAEKSGDKMSPEMQAPDVEDFVVPEISGDNPQGSEVTNEPESGDKKRVAILKNRCEPLLNPNKGNTPKSPLRGDSAENESRTNGNGGGPDRKPKAVGDPRKAKAAGGPCDVAMELAVRTECEAAMLGCGISNPRLLRVMMAAMRMQMQRERMSPGEVRMMMVRSWLRWRERYAEGFMRHVIGPRKFFGESYWLDEKLWPVDVNLILRERQRRSRL